MKQDVLNNDYIDIQTDMCKFIDSFSTVLISSVKDTQAVSSYSPFIKDDDALYICISSVAKHYHAIKQNPSKVCVMFIQDEKEAKSLFARARASFNVVAEFLPDTAKTEFFSKFEALHQNESATALIKEMKDFSIVKLNLKNGRYVKGFAKAYDTQGLKITNPAKLDNPHIK